MTSTERLRLLANFLLLFVLLAGCVANPETPDPSPTATPELKTDFEGFDGAFVLYDLNNDRYIRYNQEQCAERFLPASTFKILNSLIGLETGVILDEEYVIEWDGTQYQNPAWNQNHTLKTAIQNSVVWYYQELARRVGRKKIQEYVDAVGYGNQDITGKIDSFWLDGAVRISADEQIGLLKRLYHDDLPFSHRSMRIAREILILDETDAYRLSGKTGSGQVEGSYIGWFVGYVEEAGNVYFFATNIKSSSAEANGVRAKEITHKVLQELGLIP